MRAVSPMGGPPPGRHTFGMPLSAGPGSGDGATPDWQQVQTLRVAEVVITILKARKAMPAATAAAVSRTSHGTGYRVLVRLLEGSAAVDAVDPDGDADGAAAVFVARELAPDLAEAFGEKDVFILQ
jgi:hypothetical protein